MKKPNLFTTAIFVLILTSCESTYYQVYKTATQENLIKKDNSIIYEDENCKISYNLWDDEGDIGFVFSNKSNKNIFLNMEESFFIKNGIAYNYYKNRVFTTSTSSGAANSRVAAVSKTITEHKFSDLIRTNIVSTSNTVGIIKTAGSSVSYNEEKIVCIPAKTSKIFSEYNINRILFRDCDLYKYPSKSQIKSKVFSKEESPLVFSNRIAYFLGQTDSLIRFENLFYVAKITNYPESELKKSEYDKFCGQKSAYLIKYFRNVSADEFYIKYTKGQDNWKH